MAVIKWRHSVTLLGAVVVLAIWVDRLPKVDDRSQEERAAAEAVDWIRSAAIRCENQIRASLADPDGFDPEPWAGWRVTAEGETVLVFRLAARVRNAFGALVWGAFECRATHDGSAWTAEVRLL